VGRDPDRENPPWVATLALARVSPVTSAAAASGSTVRLKSRLPPGAISPAVEPELQAPLPCSRAKVMEPLDTVFTHHPVGATVEELKVYLAVSTVKTSSLMSFVDPATFVTVRGSTAAGSCMVTSVPAGMATVKVLAANASFKSARDKISAMKAIKIFLASICMKIP
jgi:hypothetical protein